MSHFLLNIIISIFIFFAGISAILFLKFSILKDKNNKYIKLINSFSSGIFISLGLLNFFINAINIFRKNHIHQVIIGGIFVLSFLFFIGYEHFTMNKIHSKKHKLTINLLYVIFFGLALHSFFVGFSLNFINTKTIFLIFFVISLFIHKFIVVLSMSMKLSAYHNLNDKKSILIMLLFSFITPLGIIIGSVLNLYASSIFTNNLWVIAIIWAITGGMLFYLGTFHGSSKSILVECCCSFSNFLALMFGFFLIVILSFFS